MMEVTIVAETKTVVGTKAVVVEETKVADKLVVAVVVVDAVAETNAVVLDANAMMKTKMTNSIMVRVPRPVQVATGEAATTLH